MSLDILHIQRINHSTDGMAHWHTKLEEGDEVLEPGRDGSPPFSGFAQVVAIPNAMGTRRMLAHQVEPVVIADPILGVERLARAGDQEKGIGTLNLDLLHLQVPQARKVASNQ